MEVVVESERHLNTKLFHYDFACAVGEAPILIIELLKCFPRKRQISGCDLMYLCKIMMKESRA